MSVMNATQDEKTYTSFKTQTVREALRDAMAEEMRTDENVFCSGQGSLLKPGYVDAVCARTQRLFRELGIADASDEDSEEPVQPEPPLVLLS